MCKWSYVVPKRLLLANLKNVAVTLQQNQIVTWTILCNTFLATKRNMVLTFQESLHLFQESSWSWQLKTWIAKLSYLKFLKKTLVTVFFFPSLKPWSNSTWFFCEFCYLYFYLLLLRQLGEQPIVVMKCEVSLFIRKFDIFIWAIKAFSRACNATCGTTQHNSTQHVALQVREKCF